MMTERERTNARHAPLRFMECYSEERWCAGWLIDLEHQIARYATGPDRDAFGWLVQQAGGWWTYDSQTGNQFVAGAFAELITPPARDRTRSRATSDSE